MEIPTGHPVGRRPEETKKRKGQVQISELFVEEKCSPAVLDFLRSTGIGRTVPREDGENGRRIRTGRASRLGRRIRCAFCVASCVAFAFTIWRIVGIGENLVRTRSVYLNCHGRARPNTE